uniref:Uncharacterized protein n=1 Tax=Anguilla anguilla TaxID=7936 RepID=A0A0E9S3I0_ANGAN
MTRTDFPNAEKCPRYVVCMWCIYKGPAFVVAPHYDSYSRS